MAVLPIRTYPDSVLRRKAEPVERIDDALQHLIDDMIETMYAATGNRVGGASGRRVLGGSSSLTSPAARTRTG